MEARFYMDLAHPLNRFLPKKSRPEPKLSPTPAFRSSSPPPKSAPSAPSVPPPRHNHLGPVTPEEYEWLNRFAGQAMTALISLKGHTKHDDDTGETLADHMEFVGWGSMSGSVSEHGYPQSYADAVADESFEIAVAMLRESRLRRGCR